MSTLKDITLLFVEDENLLRQAMGDYLSLYCGRLLTAVNGVEALEICKQDKPDMVLTDIIMPEMDGIVLTEKLHHLFPEIPVVLYSAFSEVPYLLRGIELGVAGFVPKPSDEETLINTLEHAALPVIQRRQVHGLTRELRQSVEQILGHGPAMKNVAEQVIRIARTDYSLLIQGETGTGKSRLASIIHGLSPRADGPLITVQFGTIPETLIAAELFGHEKGAYTGADRKREGMVSSARGGTLFLDDLDVAPPAVQSLLLRLVEEKSYQPLGSNRRVQADVRIIVASNRNLADEVAAGRFRQDLYYRLAGLVIDLPPLKAMISDLPQLASQFLSETCQEIGCEPFTLTPEALSVLTAYNWPGNIRELRNIIKRAVVMADGEISPQLLQQLLGHNAGEKHSADDPLLLGDDQASVLPLDMDSVEQWALQRALRAAQGKKMLAARLLEMNYYTFRRRLARFGLDSGEP